MATLRVRRPLWSSEPPWQASDSPPGLATVTALFQVATPTTGRACAGACRGGLGPAPPATTVIRSLETHRAPLALAAHRPEVHAHQRYETDEASCPDE